MFMYVDQNDNVGYRQIELNRQNDTDIVVRKHVDAFVLTAAVIQNFVCFLSFSIYWKKKNANKSR